MPRLFLAVWPPEDVVSQLMALRRKDERGVRFTTPESWHVTLRFLGETDIDVVEDAMKSADLPSTTAVLGPAVDVLGERVLVVPVGGLDDLAAEVIEATRDAGDLPLRRSFSGHLTIARIKKDARMPPALGAMVGGSFEVEEVALVRSRLRPDGPVYDTVAAWPVPTGTLGFR